MPSAPARPCPRCGRVGNGGRCAHCVKRVDQQRGTSTARGYGHGWPAYSRSWLARYPVCGMRRDGRQYSEHSQCTAEGRRTPATVTDHIRAIKAGGAPRDPDNHQSLCGACNRRKGIALEGGFGR